MILWNRLVDWWSGPNFWEQLASSSQAIAALLSLLALLVSLWVFGRQMKLQRWSLRVARESEILRWSRECIRCMAEVEEQLKAEIALGHQHLDKSARLTHRAHLSALIDEGRMYFPNLHEPGKGLDKARAYQGTRQEILDPLVAVYWGIDPADAQGAATDAELVAQFNELRRSFVSSCQSAIDPHRFAKVRA